MITVASVASCSNSSDLSKHESTAYALISMLRVSREIGVCNTRSFVHNGVCGSVASTEGWLPQNSSRSEISN